MRHGVPASRRAALSRAATTRSRASAVVTRVPSPARSRASRSSAQVPVSRTSAWSGSVAERALYTAGVSQHVIPAPIPEDIAKACRTAALATFRALGCAGMGRVDIRLRPDGKFFVLELNNIPGMTELSLLPDAARAHGWSFPELCEKILNMV